MEATGKGWIQQVQGIRSFKEDSRGLLDQLSSKDTWYTDQSTVYSSIIQIAESTEVEYLQMLRATGQRLVFCADATWSHRGYEANQCC